MPTRTVQLTVTFDVEAECIHTIDGWVLKSALIAKVGPRDFGGWLVCEMLMESHVLSEKLIDLYIQQEP